MTLHYDGTYEGLMTAIFDCYERKLNPSCITSASHFQPGMFDSTQHIVTDVKKAERVLKGLRKKLTPKGFKGLYLAFHSELPNIEMTIYHFTKITITHKINIERDFRQAPVLRIRQVTKMMSREIHRMHAFVRFQKTSDDIYAATIAPDFNVIPFIGDHFKKRYADQQWLIYDTQRDYGLYYDLETMQFIKLNNSDWAGRKQIKASVLKEGEQEFKRLWSQYFKATSIKERKNMKLHLQHVPKRYWRYLPEKY